MNNFLQNKKNKNLIIFFLLSIIIFVISIYIILEIGKYRNSISMNYIRLAELNSDKNTLDIYRKFFSKDSEQYLKMQKYILSKDRKEVLSLINQIESYTKLTGLVTGESSPVLSVSNRDNSLISEFNARELVIDIRVSGDIKKIEDFIDLLNNLPLISYIDEISINTSNLNRLNTANIKLIIYQKNEIK